MYFVVPNVRQCEITVKRQKVYQDWDLGSPNRGFGRNSDVVDGSFINAQNIEVI